MRASTVAALLLLVGLSLALSAPINADDQWNEDRQGDDRSDDRSNDDRWDDDHWGGRPDHRHDHQIIFDNGARGGRQIDAPPSRQHTPPMRPYWGTLRPYWKPVDPSLATHGTGMHHRSK